MAPRYLLVSLAIGLLAADSRTVNAQAPSRARGGCFQLRFERDTEITWFPDRVQWSPSARKARLAWDSTAAGAQEFRKQTRGEAAWHRLGTDSIVIVSLATAFSALDIRFAAPRDSLHGVMRWLDEGGGAKSTRSVIGVRTTCPVHDHAS
jgi:hypothetical protein